MDLIISNYIYGFNIIISQYTVVCNSWFVKLFVIMNEKK